MCVMCVYVCVCTFMNRIIPNIISMYTCTHLNRYSMRVYVPWHQTGCICLFPSRISLPVEPSTAPHVSATQEGRDIHSHTLHQLYFMDYEEHTTLNQVYFMDYEEHTLH